MPDIKCWEDSRESAQQLLPSIYNKDKEEAWKVGVNVERFEAYDSYNYYCEDSDYESSSEDNEISEEEDDSDNIEEGFSDVSESDDGNFTYSEE